MFEKRHERGGLRGVEPTSDWGQVWSLTWQSVIALHDIIKGCRSSEAQITGWKTNRLTEHYEYWTRAICIFSCLCNDESQSVRCLQLRAWGTTPISRVDDVPFQRGPASVNVPSTEPRIIFSGISPRRRRSTCSHFIASVCHPPTC